MPNEKRGQAALFDALTTKGTAFSEAERHRYGLLGLLPPAVKTLAQQVEHWAELGRALEAAGVTTAQVLDILGGDLRARERLMLKLGLANQESMYLFPVALARQTKVRFPELKKTS